MSCKKIGHTVRFDAPPVIRSSAAIAGKKEGDGPLGDRFDQIEPDAWFGQKTWEQAESAMLRRSLDLACEKAATAPGAVDYLLSGDLQNQCAGAAYALRDAGAPYFGLYGACSTMAEALTLGAMLIAGGYAETCAALTGSHYCTAERQYRFPLSYGCVRTPTAQWTVTGAGAFLLGKSGPGPRITAVTTGVIVDAGIKDMSNMGAAMAPAAYNTLRQHFMDTGRTPEYYDRIITGDLGHIGHAAVCALFRRDGVELDKRYDDCGRMVYDRERQDVHGGGSGAGCSAVVLAGHLMREFQEGKLRRLLFAATGALMSPTASMQGQSIPGICHAVSIEREDTV